MIRRLAPKPSYPPAIWSHGRYVPVDDYKREGSERMMAMHDSLPQELRLLVGEMNLQFVWDRRRQSVAAIRAAWERSHG